ncbi:MAG: glycoside hydrolase family 3 N-terminal domain-containing protein [Planctomycetia bacterium]|nr:glycoside hydrolase family 3 N-terminal domain-containing protein [Planctomycetia bacterium]
MSETRDDLDAVINAMTREEKVGQLLMIRFREGWIRDLHPGTLIVGDDDLGNDVSGARRWVAEVKRFNAEFSRIPLWIHGFVTDQDWAAPRDRWIAETCSIEEAQKLCFELGQRWRYVGLHTYPAPTVNIPIHGTCIMHGWEISDDPEPTVRYARAITRGLVRARCGTMAQHFPAHGATPVDSHYDVPVIEIGIEELMRDHIPPYVASFEEGCTTICTAHLRCPALDADPAHIATTSRPILTDFLRGRLGFKGVTIADAIGMAGFKSQGDQAETCVKAVLAGCDSICITETDDLAERVFEALLHAAGEGELPSVRLDEAVRRNLAFKRWLGLL